MKKAFALFLLIIQGILLLAQNCNKNFEQNETDPIKRTKTIITKYQTIKDNFKNVDRIRFELHDKRIYLAFISTETGVLDRGSEIGLLFNNDSVLLIKLADSPNVVSWSDGSTAASTNKEEISYSDLQKFCTSSVKTIKLYADNYRTELSGKNNSVDLPDKKAVNIQLIAKCFSDNIDTAKDLNIESSNFISASETVRPTHSKTKGTEAYLDYKYGFRGIKLETPIDSLTGMVLIGDSAKGREKWYTRTYDNMQVGEYNLNNVFYVFFHGKLEKIIIVTKGLANSRGVLEMLQDLYGRGFKDDIREEYYWKGTKLTLLYDENSITNDAEIWFDCTNLSNQSRQEEKQNQQKTEKEF